ncbi:polysaccharide pyruvyl transferase [Natrinema mahii]|nr:polysaccharide pyruvyl transferase [Natrinema mahii]
MIDTLEENFEEVSFTLESWSPELDQQVYDADVFPPLWRYPVTLPIIRFSPLTILEAGRKIPYTLMNRITGNSVRNSWLLRSKEQELIKRMSDSDLIISCGGGYLHDTYGPAFLRHLYTLSVANSIDTPVMVYAQSIGPFSSEYYGRIAASVLNGTDHITIRDKISQEYLSNIFVTETPIEVTADAAFLLTPRPSEKCSNGLSEIESSDFPVGITVRKWEYPGASDPEFLRKRYRKEMANYIDYLHRTQSADIYFFNHTPEDKREAERILTRCESTPDTTILNPDIHPRELKTMTGAVDLFVGTRMHSTIFSMAMKTPTVSIAYLPKSTDLMERLGLDQFVVDIDEVTGNDLIQMTEMIHTDESYRQKLDEGISKIKKLSGKNAEIAEQLIDD